MGRVLLPALLALGIAVLILGAVVGALVGPADAKHLVADGLVGVIVAGTLWVGLCWVIGFALRGTLARRGHEVPVLTDVPGFRSRTTFVLTAYPAMIVMMVGLYLALVNDDYLVGGIVAAAGGAGSMMAGLLRLRALKR